MELSLKFKESHLELIMLNNSDSILRIWELQNSLGWFNIHFLVKSDKSTFIYKINRIEREWTKDGPTFFEISIGQKRTELINLKDGWWDFEEHINKLIQKPMLIQVVYSSALSSDAEKNKIFTETVKSDWVLSKPSHKWLP